ncbi:MAG: type II secretion system protein GspL [Paraburkholderia sp.]|nr:type II secretion system protein GspL [Burkholderia sp. 4M9327F10]
MPRSAASGARIASLIVLLPSSDMLAAGGWEATPMPFALLGRKGEMLRAGHARFDALPQAGETVLVVAARDTLMLHAKVPPVTGPRLRRVLPNIVEEHLIQEAQRCHVAVDPVPPAPAADLRCLAVIDREWFVSVTGRFAGAGHRRVRAVPLIRCIPLPEAVSLAGSDVGPEGDSGSSSDASSELASAVSLAGDSATDPAADSATGLVADPAVDSATGNRVVAASVVIVRGESSQPPDGAVAEADLGRIEWVELALRQDSLGFGMRVNAAQLGATLAELSQRQPLEVYALTLQDGAQPDSGPGTEAGVGPGVGHAADPAIEPRIRAATGPAEAQRLRLVREATGEVGEAQRAIVPAALPERTLPFAVIARSALACRFNLCQFELASPGGNLAAAAGLKPWRVALGFLAASVVVSIVALNVQWWQLRHRRDALEAQMTQMVQTAFPNTPMVLGPHEQMTLDLTRLRGTVGALRADDFLALAASLAHALGPIPSLAIAEMDYSGGSLDVTFKPGTEIDEGDFKRRLTTSGLSVEEEDGKWKLRSAPSKLH